MNPQFKDDIKCPLCDKEIPVKRVGETYLWACPQCPFVGYEFYTLENLKDTEDYLIKGI
jgi:ribosomal protein L37AE/L43A